MSTHPRADVLPGAAAGLAAGALAIGVATALAAAMEGLEQATSAAKPIVAAGGFVVDRVPLWLKNLAVAAFGTADKAVLLASVLLVVAAACAVAGVLAMRRSGAGLWVFTAVGVLGSLVSWTRPGAGAYDAVPMWLGTAAGAGLLAAAARSTTVPGRDGVSRRTLLGGAAGVGLGVLGGVQWGAGAAPSAARPGGLATGAPASAGPLPTFSGVDPGISGQTPYVISATDFYRIDTALVVPQVDAAQWSLRVHGLVDREIVLTFDELMSKPMEHHAVTLTCVSNEVGGDLCGNAVWTGWPVRELLRLAGVKPEADMVLSTSADGWTAGTPLETLTDDRPSMLVVAMNGAALPDVHGYPVRLVVPGLYGYVSATKWVTELKVTRFDADQGYWTPRGWSAKGPIKTASRIDVPADRTQVQPADNGLVAVAGVAWAQHRGIEAVEVSVDGGPWQGAELAAEPTVDAWRQWVYRWAATPGRHTLAVRATDGTAAVQTADLARPDPDGATGHHTIEVEVVA